MDIMRIDCESQREDLKTRIGEEFDTVFVGSCECYQIEPYNKFGFQGKELNSICPGIHDSDKFYYLVPNSDLTGATLKFNHSGNCTKVIEIIPKNPKKPILVPLESLEVQTNSKFYAKDTLIVVDLIEGSKILITTKFKHKKVRYCLDSSLCTKYLIGSTDDCSIFIDGKGEVNGRLSYKTMSWKVKGLNDMWDRCLARINVERPLPFELKVKPSCKILFFKDNNK